MLSPATLGKVVVVSVGGGEGAEEIVPRRRAKDGDRRRAELQCLLAPSMA